MAETPISDSAKVELNDHLPPNPNGNMSLETLMLFVNTERVRDIEEKIRQEFKTLKEGQEKVRFLHKVQKAINNLTQNDGSFDISNDEELKRYFAEARLNGVDIPEGKWRFNAQEKERLLENFQMTTEDLSTQNEMQLQMVTRLTNERYESFQLAKSVLRPLHEDKINKARAVAGR